MKKKGLSLILATAMLAGILTGCGSSESGDSAGASADKGTADTAADSGEITKLVVWGVGTADTEDCNEVAEAISKITRKELYFYNQNLFYLYLLIYRLYYIFENAIKNSRQEKFYESLIAFFYRTLTAYYI